MRRTPNRNPFVAPAGMEHIQFVEAGLAALPAEQAVNEAKKVFNIADELIARHPDAYSDWSEVLADAILMMRKGYTSFTAPRGLRLDAEMSEAQAYGENLFASLSNVMRQTAMNNPSSSNSNGSTMTTAKFPGQSCVVCGAEFVPGTTQIEVHPTITGPKGGKKYVHSNPGECSAHSNPYAATNAGKRLMWDRDAAGGPRSVPKPGRPAPFKAPVGKEAGREMAYIHRQDLQGMSARELRNLSTSALEGVAETVLSELDRRQRGPTGRKLAWGEGPAPKFANVKSAN
jgi:hypothetical protein